MFLMREKNIEHECNDPRMIEWCVKNLKESNFIYIRGTGFGCSCEDEYGYSEHKDKNGMMVTGVFFLHSDDYRWEQWMNELNDNVIGVYYCPRCHDWAIDNDF